MYPWLKVLHVAAVLVFLGNIATGLFWHAQAARTRDATHLAFVMAGIIRSDRLLTVPGVVAIIASGVWLAVDAQYPILGTPWIRWSLVLFALSGTAFMWRVAPLQRQLLALATAGGHPEGFDYRQYSALARRWEIWGALALLAPVAAMILMILKPGD